MYKTERQCSREIIEQHRFMALHMMLQCITDLTHTSTHNAAEIAPVREIALYDCFHPRGFIKKACEALDYDPRPWRRLAADYLRCTLDFVGIQRRVVDIMERREA